MRNKLATLLFFAAAVNQAVFGQQPLRTETRARDVEVVQQVAYQGGDVVAAPSVIGTTGEGTGCYRIWASTEYLLWWMRNGSTPPLVTTGNPLDASPGALGQPGTQVLFGGERSIDQGAFNGLRATIGAWLNDDWGVEVSGFATEQRSRIFSIASDAAGNPPIYIPFFRPQDNAFGAAGESSYTIADPNFGGNGLILNGNVTVTSATRLWGAEMNALRRLNTSGNFSANLLVGFRYLGLDDDVNIFGQSNFPAVPSLQTFRESFVTKNQFYGGQLGGEVSWTTGRLSLGLVGKIALGLTHQSSNVSGAITDDPNVVGVLPQGAVFVQPSNVGSQSTDVFSVVPQLQVKVGYNILTNLRATVGYDFLYWSSVVRAGDQIDRRVNDEQQLGGPITTGGAFPTQQFNRTEFFAHGLSLGVELKY